jgi:hypothetical protein
METDPSMQTSSVHSVDWGADETSVCLASSVESEDRVQHGPSNDGGLYPKLGLIREDKPATMFGMTMTKAQLTQKVADAVRGLDKQTVDKLSHYSTVVPDARLVTVEVESSSFDIESDGQFKGRANLLVRVPFKGFGGKVASTLASLAIPAYVQGSVSDSDVSVQTILIRD